MDEIMGMFAMDTRCRAVRKLLSGNDTNCFTTEQYIEVYGRDEDRMFAKTPSQRISLELAVKHLQSTGLVREVSPGVWAASQQTGDEPQKDR
jgi:hypothetical protein